MNALKADTMMKMCRNNNVLKPCLCIDFLPECNVAKTMERLSLRKEFKIQRKREAILREEREMEKTKKV